MLKMIKSKNPDKEYPSNLGKKWTDDEEAMLLEELSKNMEIEEISKNHDRTTGGINSRRRDMAYKMYIKNIPMNEIMEKTKLDEESIALTIDRRKNIQSKKAVSLESEMAEIKNDIKELKNTIKELVEMMKAVYQFEDA
jgi:hypothetical protein